jgi:AcrR family transcriptional regulator
MASDAAADPPSDADSEARGRILGAAFGLFMEKGYAGVSTLEIATRAKVSKRDLYALVGNKQALFRACIATRARRMSALEALPSPRNRAELEATLARLGETLLGELLHPAVVAVHRLVIAEAERSPELGQEIARVREANMAAVAHFLAAAQARGVVGVGEVGEMAELYLDLLAGPRFLMRALEGARPAAAEIRRRAEEAAAAFVNLHGA